MDIIVPVERRAKLANLTNIWTLPANRQKCDDDTFTNQNGALITISKFPRKRLENWRSEEKIEIIPKNALLKSMRIQRRLQRNWGKMLLDLEWKLSMYYACIKSMCANNDDDEVLLRET